MSNPLDRVRSDVVMRVAIVRTMPGESFSMDVYADGLISGLKAIHPEWEILEIVPRPAEKHTSPWLSGLRKYYERFLRLPYYTARQEADVFHIVDHSYAHLVYWLKRAKKSVVVTCHDVINLISPENLYSRARIPMLSMAFWKFSVGGMRQADHITADSSVTANDLIRLLQIERERITVVPLGVDSIFHPIPEKEVEAFRLQHGISPNALCLLHVGRADPRKNVLTVLKVVKLLKEEGFRVCLWRVGEDFTDIQRKFLITHNIGDSVFYLGKVDKQILVYVYNAADIFLFPSLYEGFGIPVLEAMACGTPVITSNCSSLPEVAGNAAVLVEPMDIQTIVREVIRIYEDHVYRKTLVDRGFERVKGFTWEAVADQISKIYEQIV